MEVAVEAEKIAARIARKYPRAVFVAGQLLLTPDSVLNRALHNETAFMIQRRLQHSGIPMIVLPVRLDLENRRSLPRPSSRQLTRV
jgi:hypothetical protein